METVNLESWGRILAGGGNAFWEREAESTQMQGKPFQVCLIHHSTSPSTDCSYLARSTCLKGNSAIPSKVPMLGIGTYLGT